MTDTASIRDAVLRTFDAYSRESIDDLARQFAARTTGFDADGGLLKSEEGLRSLLQEFDGAFWNKLTVRNLDVNVHDGVAVSTGYIEVISRSRTNGTSFEHFWRFSDIRVAEQGEWKILHFHFSPLHYLR